jgi:hypothetical protein
MKPVRARLSQGSGRVVGGRPWTRTSGLLHVKRFRLSAVIGAWSAEQDRISYTVADFGV